MGDNPKVKICPYCGSEVERFAMHCKTCRQSLEQGVPPDISRLPNCPVCKIPIYPAKLNSYAVFHCEECEGTAVSKEALMKLQQTDVKKIVKSELSRGHVTPPYFEPRDKPPFLICVFCGKKMPETKLGGMAVDMCEKCGSLWFDRGKEKHINAILGPYKMKRLDSSGGTSRHGRSRR